MMQSPNQRNQPKAGDPKTPGPEFSRGEITPPADDATRSGVCPVCGGSLMEIRSKLQCRRCHAIIETCCEGGPQ